MTDRVIVYPGQLPQDTDILDSNLFAMIGQAYLNAAVIGSATAVSGLACTPTAPASLVVNVGVGSIYQIDQIDASAYGTLGINSNNIVKQGILQAAQSLTITPPGTTGFSQVFLVQADLQSIDTGATVLSYYNSANPAQPFSGPANSGSSQFTIRSCKCVVALKAGVPATTGTQVTPAADAGFVGLYAITVANGATQVIANNIAQLPSAPFFPTLPQVPFQVQGGNYIYAGQDTGTANAYVVTFVAGQPIPLALTAGLTVKFKALNANTGASTVNVNGLGNVSIRRGNGIALSANDIVSGGVVELTYDGTNFQMANYLGTGTNTNSNTVVGIPYVADTGTVNALIGTYSPAITAGQQVAGLTLEIKLANTITGAATINVSGLGTKAIKTGDLQNPPNGLFVAGEVLLIVYDGTQYQVANSTSLIYRKPSANTTIFVNGSTGSDTLYDGTSATVGSGTSGPFATIGKAVAAAFGYAPSQFTITISVAAGTYNESVQTPSTAGPALVIDGGSAATTTVNGGSIGTCFAVFGPNTLTVKNFTVQTSNPAFNGFSASTGATMVTMNTASNGIGLAVFGCNSGASLQPGTHTFNGSSQDLFLANTGGSINPAGGTVYTVSTAISVSAAAAQAVVGGIINMPITIPVTFVNPAFVSGKKFDATVNGAILGASQFPGTIAGTQSTGGQAVL
ncbi:hypothetical protein [Bradyrhizobium lablabi]|uniref:hypothetical protein n=1 Tax=Bradyrhizobium lablabi TaxID=722472 RepID=UPI001BABAB99|nr:hypothetical protein [Bradyrhizobium lablabi]MBR0693692.1 hypothetical protein [Bradyrhizobium lablabi]